MAEQHPPPRDPPPAARDLLGPPFADILRRMEHFFDHLPPRALSSFVAAEHVLPHFLDSLAPHIHPAYHRSSDWRNVLQRSVLRQLRNISGHEQSVPERPADSPEHVGLGMHFRLIAFVLAYRVEAGLTATAHPLELIRYLITRLGLNDAAFLSHWS